VEGRQREALEAGERGEVVVVVRGGKDEWNLNRSGKMLRTFYSSPALWKPRGTRRKKLRFNSSFVQSQLSVRLPACSYCSLFSLPFRLRG